MKGDILKLSLQAGILSGALLLACASAKATPYTVILGENDAAGTQTGPGNGPPLSKGVVPDNSGGAQSVGGHPTLAYALSNNGGNQLVPGDVLLYNPRTGALSDVLRFESWGVGYVYIYSGLTGVSSIQLANTGLPSQYQTSTLSLTEQFNGINLGYFNYTPTAGQPGYSTYLFDGSTVSGANYTYSFTSDEAAAVPDGGMTICLLGIGLLGISVLREKLARQGRE